MNPSQKIIVIKRSMRCCRCGYLSLIPLAGFVMAILAFVDFSFVRRTCGRDWNPAKARLSLGIVLASFGLMISTATVCFMIYPPFQHQNTERSQYDLE